MACVLRTLGEFSLTVDGRTAAPPSTQKARALMAFLVRHRGERISRERLIEQFWPDADTDRGRQSLSTALWSIRRTLRECGCDPAEFVSADATTVTWRVPTTLDAMEFQQLARGGDTKALEWYRGDFLPGDYDEWPSSERERIVNDLEALLGDLVSRTGSVDAAQRLLKIDPFSEAAYRALIEAEIAAGRIVAARTLAERFTQVLRENRLEPSAEFLARIASLGVQNRDALPAAFVGRAKELATFNAYLANSNHGVLLVLGNAGFGKSTLAEKFAERAAERGYGVIRLAVRQDAQSFGGWEHIYAQYGTQSFDELLMLYGPAVAAAMGDAIAAALPDRALVLVDDAHRLTGDAAHVTERILAHAQARGIHVVLFARPEGMTRLLKMCGTSVGPDISLEPLTEDEIRAAISQRGSEADGIASTLFERTQGHPLFLGRLVQRLRIDGTAVPNSLADERLPDSVRALLEERLKERGDDPFFVAGAFALDRRFTAADLAGVLEWPQPRVLDALDDLLALDLVRESAQPPYIDFSHDVIAEAAREALGAHRRRAFAMRAASLLEGAESIGDVTRLAQHLAAAGQATRAAEAYIRAGDLALRAMQPRNAKDLYDRSDALLECADSRDARRLALRAALGKGDAFNLSSEPANAQAVTEKALKLAEFSGEEELFLQLLLLHMRSSMRVDDVSAVEADATRALEMAQARADGFAEARACSGLSFYHRLQLNAHAAHDWGLRSAQCALRAGEVDYACLSLTQVASADAFYWRFAEASSVWREIEAWIGQTSKLVQAIYFSEKSRLLLAFERYEEGGAFARRAIDVLDHAPVGRCDMWVDRQRCRLIAFQYLADIAWATQAWDEGLAIVDQLFESGIIRQSQTQRAHLVETATRLLTSRRGPGDLDHAWRLICSIDVNAIAAEAAHYMQCARALVSAGMRRPNAHSEIRKGLDDSIRLAKEAPFEADGSFRTLADAARELGDVSLLSEATSLFEHYRAMRREAAGAAWGGAEPFAL